MAPIMTLYTDDINQNRISITMQNFLMSEQSQVTFFNNVLNILNSKGYYGINLNIPYILPQNRENFVNFMVRFSDILNKMGYFLVFNTLNYNSFEIVTGIIYEGFDYVKLFQSIDGLILMTYEWGNLVEFPTGIITFERKRRFISARAERYTPEKVFLGIPVIGYIWEMPFIIGVSRGMAVTSNSAVELAKDMGTDIQFDEISKTAYFQYTLDREYVVRFRDARTIYEYLNLARELGLKGISIWNIMQYFPQLWLIVNSLFDIENILESGNI